MAVQNATEPSPQLVSPDKIMPVDDQMLRKLILPWQTGLKASWTIAQLRSALLQQRQGLLGLSSQLFDSLLEDDEFPGTLARRVNATLESPFCLRSYEGPKVPLTKREQKIEKLFPEMCPDEELFDFLATWLIMGVSVGVLDWDTSGAIWMPRLRTLPTEFLYWDSNLLRWKYQARDQPELIVEPGNGKWVLLGHGQRSWIWGLLRGLALTWLGKQMTFCDWQRYSQKHGLPIIKAMIPIWRDEAEKTQFVADLGQLISEGVVGLPQDENSSGQTTGYDIDLLEAKTVSWQGFQAALERADRKMQVQLLGGNLGAEATSKGSNRAAAEVHSDSLAGLAGADQKRLGQELRRQVLGPFMSLNFGVPLPEVPTPYWAANPEHDARQWAPARAQLATTLESLSHAGVEVTNLEEVGAEFGLELKAAVKVGELPANMPPPPPAPADSPPAAGKTAAGKTASKPKAGKAKAAK
jgi:phage gp29-like protein